MIKPVLKTLSLAFVAFAAVSTSAAEQSPMLHLATMPMAVGVSCSAEVEIERGWEAQQRLLDERLAAKGLAVDIPGTIISPPLPDFAGSRADLRKAATKPAASKAGASSRSQRSNRM